MVQNQWDSSCSSVADDTIADNIFKYFFFFLPETGLGISFELSYKTIQMK